MTKTISLKAAPVLLGLIAAVAALVGAGTSQVLSASPQIAALMALIAVGFGAVILELRARRRQAERLEDAILKIAGGLERAGAHLAAIDDRARDIEQWIASDARGGGDQSAAEIEMLGTLVKELAVTVAHHDAELGATPTQARQAQTQTPAGGAEEVASPGRGLASSVDRAVTQGAFDLHLQPIVSLPQRRVKFYEAFARLRDANGDLLPRAAAGEIDRARRIALDIATVRRLGVAARRLASRNRDISVFLHLSDDTLAAPEALLSALHGAQDASSHIVILLSQSAARILGSAGLAKLKPILDLGFCFGLDGVVDLRIDARTLFDHGVRFVKAPASLLLSDSGRAPTEIHPQDLSRLLTRNGIQLIADSIDLEKTVVEALDLDVRFGQGDAFSPPRPMKPELLEPVADQPVTPSAPAANDAPPAETQPKRVSYRSTLRRA